MLVIYAGLYVLGAQHQREGTWNLTWLGVMVVAALTDRLDGFLAKREMTRALDQVLHEQIVGALLERAGQLEADLAALVVLNWRLDAGPMRANRVDLAERPVAAHRSRMTSSASS